MPPAQATMAAPYKRSRSVGRQRKLPDTSTYEGKFCAHLNALMEQRGLSPIEFGERVGCGKSMAYHWLSGRGVPPLEKWPKIAKVLRVDIADLLPPK